MSKKPNAKERREAQWLKTLDKRLNKKKYNNEKIATIELDEDDEVASLEKINYDVNNELTNYRILKKDFSSANEVNQARKKFMKSRKQLAAEKLEKQEVLPLQDDILDESKTVERQAIIAKMKNILKRRFDLGLIADALQTNNYEKLDEENLQREEIINKILEINSTVNDSKSNSKIIMFSRFQYRVGDNNAKLYTEQENLMRFLLEYINQGLYIKKAKERLSDAIDDYIEPSEEYGMLKSEMKKWKTGKMSENQKEKLVKKIVDFSVDCKDFYSDILMKANEKKQCVSQATLKISSQIEDASNSVIEKNSELEDITNSKMIYDDVLRVFDSGIQKIENTILRTEIQYAYEDMVANVLDNPKFNFACEIETKYFSYELDRMAQILDNLEERYALADTVEKCRKLSNSIKTREEAYMTIEELIAGKSKPTLKVDIKDDFNFEK